VCPAYQFIHLLSREGRVSVLGRGEGGGGEKERFGGRDVCPAYQFIHLLSRKGHVSVLGRGEDGGREREMLVGVRQNLREGEEAGRTLRGGREREGVRAGICSDDLNGEDMASEQP
jgi:hypothetical protein